MITHLPFQFRSAKTLALACFLFWGFQSISGSAVRLDVDEKEKIERILTEQGARWNDKDIEGFMQTYWKSADLTFSSGGKTTRGWQATLDRYKTKYPPEKMGHLTFDELETTIIADTAALVLGQWHLKLKDNNADGNFSLVLRKMNGQWKIIHDHSSLLENKE